MVFVNCFPTGQHDDVTCKTGKARLCGGLMLFIYYLLILPMSGQEFYWSILFLVAVIWSNFIVDEFIGAVPQCCCIWKEYIKLNKLSSCNQDLLYSVSPC